VVRCQFALAIVVHQLRNGNRLQAQAWVIQIDFPAECRDLQQRPTTCPRTVRSNRSPSYDVSACHQLLPLAI
jgi:hypothetical protein